MTANDFRESGVLYLAPGEEIIDTRSTSHVTIPILESLWGQPNDDYANSLIEALQPHSIREQSIHAEVKSIGTIGREVTIWLDGDTIQRIELVGWFKLPTGCHNGHEFHLEMELRGVWKR